MKKYLVQKIIKEDIEVVASSKEEALEFAKSGKGTKHETVEGSVTFGNVEILEKTTEDVMKSQVNYLSNYFFGRK